MVHLDLASLESVRTFADAVKHRLADDRIDMLVLNAGVQYPNVDQRSDDGFEKTFAVNHLSHYLLARELLPCLAEGGRLVITTSDTHDPGHYPFAPKELNTQALAYPPKGGFDAGVRAYAASKLCNLLTARTFAELDEVKASNIQVVAYNPGFTTDTSLFRNASGFSGTLSRLMTSSPGRLVFRFASRFNPDLYPETPERSRLMTSSPGRLVFRFASRFNPDLYPETPERAGEALAQLTLGRATPPSGSIYASLVRSDITYPDPSELARSHEARDRLWRESSKIVDITE
ncbi:SDR family NAD(P)-dependent oxidoreductase [Halococcus hamelinensis]|uniref:Dehydrogenase/reductase n=1 Tax=Halococcus hamelinensis 100A6 TaxID=1132509 RepID=M0LW29_9EURY|nr:SDR family NAD(P)-dependent oxidoreductase [Halococcus hamelinensis]EMA37792.1 dehydrogenase/reductase [Halococcus hamelinensis 100A6]